MGNWGLIAANVLIFVFTHIVGGALGERLQTLYALDPVRPALHQYLTYQFLHGDWIHLTTNMLFLWIFGNAVCDRMGTPAYLLFYLAGGVFAGIGFAVQNVNPMVGASGSIAAVTTAFLALYPRVHIEMLMWAIVVFTFQVPAMILIVFKIILWDNIVAPRIDAQAAMSNVAYSAHLAGYGFGLGAALFLLGLQALPRNPFDLLGVWDRWRRRHGLGGGRAVTGAARPVYAEEVDSRPLESAASTPERELRERIAESLDRRDLAQAAALFLDWRRLGGGPALPRQALLDIANHSTQQQDYANAAAAFESFLAAYPASPDIGQVRLMLGMIYRRYLMRSAEAIALLRLALPALALDSQRALAEAELEAAAKMGQGSS